MKFLSVVIPTYNRLDILNYVLEAFKEQTLSPDKFEVILIDSMSQDGTEEFAEAFQAKFAFRYIRQENRGRSGARNRGIQEAKGDVIFFTDSDIIPEKDLLEKHWQFHEKNSNKAAVGWESRIDNVGELTFAKEHPQTRFRIHPPSRTHLTWLYFLTGNTSVARQTLLDVGLFDEAFQGYGFEDLELGYRLEKAGVEIEYLLSAVNYHVHPRSLEAKMDVQRMAGRNAVLFYKKHKDERIRWLLGMSPPAFFWHSLLSMLSPLRHWFEKQAQHQEGKPSFAQEVITQYYYLCGVKESWRG